LCSGAMAHVLGLAEEHDEVDESWWSLENLTKVRTCAFYDGLLVTFALQLEKATKRRRGGRPSAAVVAPSEKWVERTVSLLATFDPAPSPPPTPKPVVPLTITLRDRSKKANTGTPSASASESGTPPPKSRSVAPGVRVGRKSTAGTPGKDIEAANLVVKLEQVEVEAEDAPKKKLPRVLLRVNPPTPAGQGA
jgi:histone deacetylase HOS3